MCDFSYALLDAGIFGSELCHMGLVLRYVMRLPQICHIMLENLSQYFDKQRNLQIVVIRDDIMIDLFFHLQEV